MDALLVSLTATHDYFGGDGRLYSAAAATWLAGGDPWAHPFGLFYVVAPPPTLIPYVLTAWLPLRFAGWIWVLIGAGCAILTVRRLRLPLWWLSFPPLVEAVVDGSVEPLVLLVLVAGPWALAPLLKAYAALPLIGERRWRAIGAAASLGLASLILLPWGLYLSHLPDLVRFDTALAQGGLSAASQPVLAAVTVAGMAVVGWRRAWYLAIPALWPNAMFHYSALALPVVPELPVVAAAAATPIVPYLVPLAVIYLGGRELIRRLVGRPGAPGLEVERVEAA